MAHGPVQIIRAIDTSHFSPWLTTCAFWLFWLFVPFLLPPHYLPSFSLCKLSLTWYFLVNSYGFHLKPAHRRHGEPGDSA